MGGGGGTIFWTAYGSSGTGIAGLAFISISCLRLWGQGNIDLDLLNLGTNSCMGLQLPASSRSYHIFVSSSIVSYPEELKEVNIAACNNASKVV